MATPTSARTPNRSTSGPRPGHRTTRRSTSRRPGSSPWNWSAASPRTGLCDSVAAFRATHAEVTHEWVNYTGCDSLYSVAADSSAVYIGGHERWADNPNGCNHQGAGALPAPGTGRLQPVQRGTDHQLQRHRLYSRSRGRGADDLLVTGAGLWVASDNFGGGTSCGGKPGYAGICFLPYSLIRGATVPAQEESSCSKETMPTGGGNLACEAALIGPPPRLPSAFPRPRPSPPPGVPTPGPADTHLVDVQRDTQDDPPDRGLRRHHVRGGQLHLDQRIATARHPEQRLQRSATPHRSRSLVGPERQRHGQHASRSTACATAYLGGSSPRWAGRRPRTSPRSAPRPARSSPASRHNAGGQVETMLAVQRAPADRRLLHAINGSSANPYMTSLSPSTGKDDGFSTWTSPATTSSRA